MDIVLDGDIKLYKIIYSFGVIYIINMK